MFIALGLQLTALQGADAQVSEEKSRLDVKFASNVAESYIVEVNRNEKYTILQSYSWARDDSSRYNLFSYSLDNGGPVEIPRKARGTFWLDVQMDTDHTVTFAAKVQNPLSVPPSMDNAIRLYPPSPTGDGWFDAGTKQQYYLDVISEHGTVVGEGWYDSGSEATISIKPPANSFPINHVFEGSDGVEWAESDRYSAKILMDSPKSLAVKWRPDYSQLLTVAVAATVSAAATLLIVRKKSAKKPMPDLPPIAVADIANGQSTIATVSSSTGSLHDPQGEHSATGWDNQTNGDEYARELMQFAQAKSVEILESMHTAGLVSDSRFAGTREKLDQSFV